jgi:hypothetical protein
MDFLDNDLVRNAKEQYGGEAADGVDAAAANYIGKDAADAAVGELSSLLGIHRHGDGQAAQAPAETADASAGESAADSSEAEPSSDDN